MLEIKSFKVDYLGIEITRRCNLQCAHCLRGDCENKDISDATLENTFSNVTEIGTLFLSGGEPFIAPERIEYILSLLNQRNIKVHTISITTNATVLSQRQIDIIHKIEQIAKLDIRFSHDKFHEIEHARKGLTEKFTKNIETFASLGYTNENHSFAVDSDGIRNIGRAKNLTPSILDAINNWRYQTNYTFNVLGSPNTFDIMHLIYEAPGNIRILGNVLFDVNGNLVNNDMPYEKEDKAPFFRISCSNRTILDAMKEYEQHMGNDYDEYYKEYKPEQYIDIYNSSSENKLK